MPQLHKDHLLLCLLQHSPLNRTNVNSGKCDAQTFSYKAENLDRRWFFFLFFWGGRFQYFTSVFQIILISKLRRYNWTEKVYRDRYNAFSPIQFSNPFGFLQPWRQPMLLLCRKGFKYYWKTISNRKSFQSYKKLDGFIWSKFSVQCLWT